MIRGELRRLIITDISVAYLGQLEVFMSIPKSDPVNRNRKESFFKDRTVATRSNGRYKPNPKVNVAFPQPSQLSEWLLDDATLIRFRAVD